MATLPPGAAASAPPQSTGASDPVKSAAKQAASALAHLYMACHEAAPDSPACDAVQQMQRVVAEIATQGSAALEPQPHDMASAAAAVHHATAGPPPQGGGYA